MEDKKEEVKIGNVTENDLLEMGEHFKKLIKEKNEQLNRYKKLLCCLYGLVKASDDYHNIDFIEIIRGYLSCEICKLCDMDSEDD